MWVKCSQVLTKKHNCVEKDRYAGLDGLRTYASLGIIVMHVLANGDYKFQGFIGRRIIPSFYNLVFLFMMVSAFGMCCGYYDRIRKCNISIDEFYKRRISQVWPFFATLNIVDVLISPSKTALYELYANLTLCFGMLPNPQMKVIGVGWTLGVIFVFYLLFPFFCYLMGETKRAYLTFIIALIFNVICSIYFNAERWNIVYSFVYFVIGGLVFLNREKLKEFVERRKLLSILLMLVTIVLYYMIGENTVTLSLTCGAFLIVALGCSEKGILSNPLTKFISSISFEMYLCHMLIFRALEMINLGDICKNEIISYVIMCVCTIIGSIMFSLTAKILIIKIRISNERR